jgi:protein deglycase
MSHVLVPLAQGCEELEAITITDLLVRAGVKVIPDTSIDQVMEQDFDMIVLPGGLPGADHLRDDANVQALIKKQFAAGRYLGAICAAPKALAQAGVLEGRTATSFPGALSALNDDSITISDRSIEIDGPIVTSRGPGTAMDFTLKLIELLEGIEIRDQVEKKLAR